MFELQVKSHFSAAHQIRNYPGDCARVHGHNWEVIVYIQASELDEQGIGVDFRVVKDALQSALGEFDHRDINEHSAFQEINPTSETIARYLYKKLGDELNTAQVKVTRVQVAESPGTSAAYFE